MGADTKIQWAHHTFNPWRGCIKIAEGCKFCYADAQSRRNPGTLGIWGPDGTRVVASESMWRQPLKWHLQARDRQAYHSAYLSTDSARPRVFCASLADWAEDWDGCPTFSDGSAVCLCGDCGDGFRRFSIASGPPGCADCGSGNCRMASLNDVRARLFALIDATPHLDWLLLTKRPENILRMVPAYFPGGYIAEAGRMNQEGPRPNLWLGTSVACQEDADRVIPELLKCRDLAAKLFVSVEPLLGPVDIRRFIRGNCDTCGTPCKSYHVGASIHFRCGDEVANGIDWVIVGGESGPNARPCRLEWIDAIVRQCRGAGVPVFVKQLGAFSEGYEQGTAIAYRPTIHWRDPKGGDPSEWPESLRVREVPS